MLVTIQVTEPWEFGEALAWRRIGGELVRIEDDEHGGKGLIRLEFSLPDHDKPCSYVVASPRHSGDELASLLEGRSVFCSFIAIGGDTEPLSLDAISWRGGLAFIGTVQPFSAQDRSTE